MLPDFLVQETIVRESGESAVFEIGQDSRRSLMLTFSITHAVEQQSIQFEIYGSPDGCVWHPEPLVKLGPKCYCGDYQARLHHERTRFVKAVWKVTRWARTDQRPFFRFHIFAEIAKTQAAYAGAA